YQYPRLPEDRDHFRLVSIAPYNNVQTGGCIHGKMLVAAVDNCGDYDALSYCWSGHTLSGNPTEMQAEPQRMVIDTPDGTGTLGYIPITPSLGMALRHLGVRMPQRPIFIDQICINQEDTDERGRQVALMGQIYGQCASVVGWLGP
ncbi:heterokaryon incompatibility protein-domain-containing protein, partial [Lasiosphaeris hirsuta]